LSRRRDIFVLLFFVLVFFFILYLMFGMISPSDSIGDLNLSGGEKIALIRIIGPIYDATPYLEQLEKVEDASAIKALVVRLETPGGAVAASQEVYHKLTYLRDELEIPIVASMGNVAASGGYYIALGADSILASSGSITGSIGVIMFLQQYYELFDKIGVSHTVIKSGKFKDAGSPYRELTHDDREYFQSFIDDGYQQFIEAVALERDMPLTEVKPIADGRVFTGRQAESLGLIDLIGGYDDAVMLAAELGGISGKPKVIELEKRKKYTLLDLLLDDLDAIVYQKFGLNIPFRYEMP